MNAWWWVLVGLAAWSGVSLAVGLWLGPVLGRSSRALEAPNVHTGETLAGHLEPPQHGPRAA
jgi:hypothetical protein